MKKRFNKLMADVVNPEVFKDGDWWFQWCCDCQLRHIWMLKIQRGKTPKDDRIFAYSTRDSLATEMRRLLIKKGLMRK